MPSLQSRILYTAMKLIYSRIFPPGISLETIRKGGAESGGFERLPRDTDCEAGDLGGVPGEWITPPNAAADRVLLYLHGGGYITKTPAIHRVLVARMAQAAGVRGFMLDYRLAPECPFPAALDDAIAAYKELLAQGIQPAHIVVAGDSAGGGLTAALLLHLRNAGEPLPAAAGIISGLLDCTLSGESLPTDQQRDPFLRIQDLQIWTKHYYRDHDPRHPLISPVFADLHGLPPLLIHIGDREILLAEALRFAEMAQAAGVNVTLKVWPGMLHAFPVFAGFVPEGKIAIAEMGAFFRTYF